jgi:hypothetical protein
LWRDFIFYLLSWLCASFDAFSYLVGVEARCNHYLHDINIVFFIEQRVHEVSAEGLLGWMCTPDGAVMMISENLIVCSK